MKRKLDWISKEFSMIEAIYFMVMAALVGFVAATSTMGWSITIALLGGVGVLVLGGAIKVLRFKRTVEGTFNAVEGIFEVLGAKNDEDEKGDKV